MEAFSALLDFFAGNSLVTGEFTSQKPVTRSFDSLFDLRLNKRLSKQSWGWWFETTSGSLWRHCYVLVYDDRLCIQVFICWTMMTIYVFVFKYSSARCVAVGSVLHVRLLSLRVRCTSWTLGLLSSDVVVLNSLWPSGRIFRHKSRSTLAQVIACWCSGNVLVP